MEFLDAIYYQKILTPALINSMQVDMIANATIVYSPSFILPQDWHYGLGNWVECESSTFDCSSISIISSPGAYGAYPFIDYENKYFGMIARQGDLGTFVEGFNLYSHVKSDIENLISIECN